MMKGMKDVYPAQCRNHLSHRALQVIYEQNMSKRGVCRRAWSPIIRVGSACRVLVVSPFRGLTRPVRSKKKLSAQLLLRRLAFRVGYEGAPRSRAVVLEGRGFVRVP